MLVLFTWCVLIQYCLTSFQRHVSARSVVTASSTGTRRSATGMTSAPPPVPRGVQGRHITQHTFEYHANVTVTINLQRCTVGITNYAFGNILYIITSAHTMFCTCYVTYVYYLRSRCTLHWWILCFFEQLERTSRVHRPLPRVVSSMHASHARQMTSWCSLMFSSFL